MSIVFFPFVSSDLPIDIHMHSLLAGEHSGGYWVIV